MQIDTENETIELEFDGYNVQIDFGKVKHVIEENDDLVDPDGEGLDKLQRKVAHSTYVSVNPTNEKWEELADQLVED